jgi:CheY-like chemotaxis protein
MIDECRSTIIVVDDDEEIRDTLKEILEDEGYAVRSAKNGADALTLLRSLDSNPCIILLDLMMPVMDGFEFRARQLEDTKLEGIPIVVFSADGNTQNKAESLNAAAALRKPVRLEDLLRTVREHCVAMAR